MYCRSCKYPLEHLEHSTCPECGLEFDPDEPGSFIESLDEPKDNLGRFLVVWSSYCVVALGGFLLLALVTVLLRFI